MLFLSLLLTLVPSVAFNTLAGDDMVFEKSYPDLSTLISSPIANYMGWTARLSNIFTLNLIFGSTPDSITHLIGLPLSLTTLGVSTWYMLSGLLKATGRQYYNLTAWIGSLSLTLVLCLYSHTTYDNFYWIAGIVTYVLPLSFFNLIIGYSSRSISLNSGQLQPLTFITLIALTIIMGLYNEGFIIQCLALLLVTFIALITAKGRSTPRKLILAFTAITSGLIIAALIMRVAPGTLYRMDLLDSMNTATDNSILGLLKLSVHTTLDELKVFSIYNKYGVTLMMAVAALLGIIQKQVTAQRKGLIILTSTGVLMPLVAFYSLALAVHYAHQPSITDYSLLTAYYLTYLGIIVATYALALLVSPSLHQRGTVIVGSLISTAILMLCFPATQRIAQIYTFINLQRHEFQETNDIIREAKQEGKREINIGTSTRFFTYCVPHTSRTTWCNDAYQQYYNVEAITASQYIDAEATQKNKEGK